MAAHDLLIAVELAKLDREQLKPNLLRRTS
jgi:hypothetical protein